MARQEQGLRVALVGAVVCIGALLLGRGATASFAWLDWDPVAVWTEWATADERAVANELTLRQVSDARTWRANTIRGVLIGNFSEAEGLERFRVIAETVRGYADALRTTYPDLSLPEAVAVDYRLDLDQAQPLF